MSKKSQRPQSRHHIWVFDEDWELLTHLYTQVGGIGVGPAVRAIVHKHCEALRARLAAAATAPAPTTQD